MSTPEPVPALSPAVDGMLLGGRYQLGELLGVGGSASVFAAVDLGADGDPASGSIPASESAPASRGDRAPGGRPALGADPVPGHAGGPEDAARASGGGTRVAVKLLHPHLCDGAASRDAFLREAERAGTLQHPNVVRVHAAGLHDAAGVIQPWIALDLLDGPTLRERVESGGPLAPGEAAAVIDGVLAGLAYAHEAGLVHRDLSPQNIVLAGVAPSGDPATSRRASARAAPLRAEHVRIVDFGLADVTGLATRGGDVLLAASGGGVVGSAAFMSPEQAQGRPVRSVSDLYQVGCLLFYALTGRTPFPRETAELALAAHVSAPPPVASALQPAAAPLDRIIIRALAKTPAHRFRNAEEFAAALRSVEFPPPAIDQGAEAGAGDGGARGAHGGYAATTVLPAGAAGAAGAAAGGSLGYLAGRGGAGGVGDAAIPGGSAPASGTAGLAADGAGSSQGSGPAVLIAGALITAVVTVGVIAATVNSRASSGPETQTTTSAPVTSEPAPTTSAPPTTAPPTTTPPSSAPPPPVVAQRPADIAVPTLFGSLASAEAALRGAGLALGQVIRTDSPEQLDRVLGQQPSAGSMLQPGSRVDITVASGSNVVPEVGGMDANTAMAVVQSAGFGVARDPIWAPGSAVVAGTRPAAGSVLRVGVMVTLTFGADLPEGEPEP